MTRIEARGWPGRLAAGSQSDKMLVTERSLRLQFVVLNSSNSIETGIFALTLCCKFAGM